jgi:hypothetical protein
MDRLEYVYSIQQTLKKKTLGFGPIRISCGCRVSHVPGDLFCVRLHLRHGTKHSKQQLDAKSWCIAAQTIRGILSFWILLGLRSCS